MKPEEPLSLSFLICVEFGIPNLKKLQLSISYRNTGKVHARTRTNSGSSVLNRSFFDVFDVFSSEAT